MQAQSVKESKGKMLKLGSQVKSTEVLVGEEVLVLREPSIAATHEILESIFDDAFSSGLSSLSVLLNGKGSEEGLGTWMVQNLGGISAVLKDAVIPLVTKKAGLVASVVLDTKQNRERLNMVSEELREWVVEELSTTQTLALVHGLKDLVDWSELVKQLKALIPNLLETETEEAVPQSETTSSTPA